MCDILIFVLYIEGLVEIHLTLGEMELKNFDNTQNSLIRGKLPHFVKVRFGWTRAVRVVYIYIYYPSNFFYEFEIVF